MLFDYDVLKKTRVYHKGGHRYVVSPYDILWVNDRVYVTCYEDERQQIITPRLDKLADVQIEKEDAVPRPEGYDLGYYYTSCYKMYSGPEQEVTLRCNKSVMTKFADRFGMDPKCMPVSDDAFRATVTTCVGKTFFGWLAQYAGDIVIESPAEVRQQYRDHLMKAVNDHTD